MLLPRSHSLGSDHLSFSVQAAAVSWRRSYTASHSPSIYTFSLPFYILYLLTPRLTQARCGMSSICHYWDIISIVPTLLWSPNRCSWRWKRLLVSPFILAYEVLPWNDFAPLIFQMVWPEPERVFFPQDPSTCVSVVVATSLKLATKAHPRSSKCLSLFPNALRCPSCFFCFQEKKEKHGTSQTWNLRDCSYFSCGLFHNLWGCWGWQHCMK